MTNYPKGSMGAADQKNTNGFKIVMALVTLLLFFMTYFGVPHSNLYEWHKHAAGFWKFLGVVLFVAMFMPIIFQQKIEDETQSERSWFIIWFILLGLSFLVSAGFDFSLK